MPSEALDQEVGQVVATLPDGTEYRQVLLNPQPGTPHITPDGRAWVAVREQVVDGVVSSSPFTIHWKSLLPGMPDLMPVKLPGHPDNILKFCDPANHAVVFSVRNIGAALAPEFTVEVRFPPKQVFRGHSEFVPSGGTLAAGANKDFAVDIPAGAFEPDADYFIIVQPVPGESNTSNNIVAGRCIG